MKRVLIYLLRYRQTHYKFQINQSPSYHPQKLYSRPVSPAKVKTRPKGWVLTLALSGSNPRSFAKQTYRGFSGAQCSEISLLISRTSGGGFSRYPSSPA